MKSKILIALLSISTLVLISCGQSVQAPSNDTGNTKTETQNTNVVSEAKSTQTNIATEKNTINITADGFSPDTLTIKVGDKVIFLNKDSEPHWPASGKHPIHTDYPGSSIEKCGTPEQIGIFDACKGLSQNERFEFVFTQKGTWNYHDHLDASKYGTIIVD